MSQDQLSMTFSALADPTRRAILARLSEGERTVKDLAEPFSMTLPAITKHLKVLQKAGLVKQGRQAQWRPCRLEAEPLKTASDWIEEFRDNWEQSFSRLDNYLKTLQEKQADLDQ